MNFPFSHDKKKFFFIPFGIILFFIVRVSYAQIVPVLRPFSPRVVSMVLIPPKNSLTAIVKTLQGSVQKEGRKDTKFQQIQKATTLVEGESILTNNGSLTLDFPHVINLSLKNNTQVDYLNGLPNNLVIRQPSGSVVYTVSQSISPFSIRSLGLLLQISDKAIVTVTTNADTKTITVNVKTGSVALAYSDANDSTQVVTVIDGETALYDYQQSLLTVE